MGYIREPFEEWIATVKRDNGKPYSKETISSYISSLKTHASKLTDIELDSTDLFNIDSLDSFKPIYKRIKESVDFVRINEAYHRVFSSALSVYETCFPNEC